MKISNEVPKLVLGMILWATSASVHSAGVNGVYVSEITVTGPRTAIGKKYRRARITLEQTGDQIRGSDPSQRFDIRGTREGNTIEFYVITGNEIIGTWEVNHDASRLVGNWFTNGGGGASGTWNLTRVD